MRIGKYLYIAAVLLIFFSHPVLAAEDTIENIHVHLSAGDTKVLPANAQKRMTKSISTIGEQLLLGRRTTEVAANHAAYEKLIQEVFDRVLVGYSIQAVQLLPSNQTAEIRLMLTPWGETVHQAVLEVDYGGAAPEIVQLMRQDMGNLQKTIDEALIGLPVDSIDWAGSVAKSVVREELESRLPEFRSSLDIIPGERTVVKLTLSPTSPIVQNVHVALRSHTIPNLLLEQIRPGLETVANNLSGIPVAFIDRHREYFTRRMSEITQNHTLAKRYGLTFTPGINAAPEAEITLKAETNLYNVTLEGYLDMGRYEDNTSFKLHVGKNFDKKTELFIETIFIPGNVTWRFMPGILYHHDDTSVGTKYDISSERFILLFNQYLGHRWSVRFERTPAERRNEIGLRYKLHEFISAEYVFNSSEKWLRIVGHL